MASASLWIWIAVAVAVAAAANSVSAIWAAGPNKVSVWLPAMLILSPLVFVTFGTVAARTGLAVASGTVDALLTAVTMLIGLIFFREWTKTSLLQYLGMAFSLVGICLMVFFPKTPA
ncbi:MAG TPA: hypothetical protein VG942_19065 [Hyphomonadaceae bacterium]|nr:hypothetical protein [Hyphomonadaceae bacterium]